MFTKRWLSLTGGIVVILAGTALAGDKSASKARVWTAQTNAGGRQVKIWQSEGTPTPPMPPNMSQNEMMPQPEEELPEQSYQSGGSSPYSGGCSNGNCSSGSCGTGGCAGPCDQCGLDECGCTPFYAHRCSFFGESLYLTPSGANMSYAIQQNGVGGPGTVPAGRVGVVDPDFNSGFRTGFNWALNNCSSIGVTYANFQTHETDSITAPAGVGGTVQSLVLHPNSVNAGSTSSLINAALDVDFQYLDIDYRALLAGGFRHALNYTIGVRYGNLRQDFQTLGNFTQPSGSILNTTSIKFDGVGLRTGLDGEHRIGGGGVSVYGKSFINVLFGQFRTSYNQVDTVSTIVQARSTWNDDRVVPVLDYEVGVRWTSCSGRWVLSTGYYTAFWFNTITTPQYVQAVQNADFVNLGDTISFTGLVSRVEFRF